MMQRIGSRLLGACLSVVLLLSSCGGIPDKAVPITPTLSPTYTELFFGGLIAIAAYRYIDPLAPNWEIYEAPLETQGNPTDGSNAVDHSYYYIEMRMKRIHTGGSGEANMLFKRRAMEITRIAGFDRYQVMEYNEWLESETLGARRRASGLIHMYRQGAEPLPNTNTFGNPQRFQERP